MSIEKVDEILKDFRSNFYRSLRSNASLIVEKKQVEEVDPEVVKIKEILDDEKKNTNDILNSIVSLKRDKLLEKPSHEPWYLKKVISGHTGWVNCVSVDKSNDWFTTGSDDKLIKIWDIATTQLKLSLTGHVGAVKTLKVSDRHPYLFSGGDDNQVKCWDLNMNIVVRDYHGHLNGVYTLDIHPSLDLLATAGRDAVVRVWDIRTRAMVHVMEGHTHTVAKVLCQNHEPQIISGSHDTTIRCWDIVSGKTKKYGDMPLVLTHHKKAIKGLVAHPNQYLYASAAGDNLKLWRGETLEFVRNFEKARTFINALATIEDVNNRALLVGAGDTGSLCFWDWDTGVLLDTIDTPPQPGSLAAENSILDLSFDRSETRLITCGMDKTVKIYARN